MKAHFAEVHCFFVSSRKQHNPLFLKTKKAVKKDALDICSSQLIFLYLLFSLYYPKIML